MSWLRVTEMLNRWLGNSWAFVVAGGILAILAFPHLVSAFHVEAAGREIVDPELETHDLQPALAHLQKAIKWEPNNAQAYRLLGKVYRAQGDWPAAIEALTRYTELRPDNPLGHLELAGIYEAVEAEVQAMHSVDLIAALPQAAVEAPDVPVDTPHARPDGPAWHSYVAATTFSLPPNFGERLTLFMHAPSRVTYTLALPTETALLRFGMGMDLQTHGWPGDGATFEVFVGDERIFLEHVDKAMARQGWHERTLDLAPWAGQKMVLTLAVTPGPVADPSGDWAGWGEPQVVDAWLQVAEAQDVGQRLVDEWSRAGLTTEDFIHRGEEARKAKQYDEAMAWYERAMRLEPGLGDPWYYVGLLYENQQQWLPALDAYERAVAMKRFVQVHRSSPHYRAGILYQGRLDPRQPEKALAAYEAALDAGDFSSRVEVTDCHYKRGWILYSQKADPSEYMAEFRRTIELDPEHVWAHILLGVSIYNQDRDTTAAEAELLRALELAPQDKWAHYSLGEVYRREGRTDEAAAMYQQALMIDPDFEPAQKKLQALNGGR
ncbi:MAG: tetratricopeptide repeat protein [Anaerolineae bacterium]|nr:MAG: tetratricopeptide repeat protein [Anaerolineae bacterium]